jgi:hypothetical protein
VGLLKKSVIGFSQKRDASLSLSMRRYTRGVILSGAKNLTFSTAPQSTFPLTPMRLSHTTAPSHALACIIHQPPSRQSKMARFAPDAENRASSSPFLVPSWLGGETNRSCAFCASLRPSLSVIPSSCYHVNPCFQSASICGSLPSFPP